MFLGALLDLGVSERTLRRELAKLKLPGWSLSIKRANHRGIAGVKLDVHVRQTGSLLHRSHDHRAFADIKRLIERSRLESGTKSRAISIFQRIAAAEAKIHGVPVAKVHFHEVGAVDSIVDIVGAAVAMRELGVDKVLAREIEDGTGFVEIAHGRFPIPAPATLEILRGVKIRQCDEPNEMVTPTGAAILAEFVAEYGPMPAMEIEKIGYGVGTRQLRTRPNVLRAVLGHSSTQALRHPGTISVLETNIDDMNPQLFGDVMEKLFAAGALDVFYTPVQMKKNRPGTLVTVLAEPKLADKLIELMLHHTTTFGVRVTEARRHILDRETRNVNTRYGTVALKIGRLNGRVVSASPEYDSCRKAAARHKVPVKLVYAAAQKAT
jgi:uncharacterized protein (TIGR00299 family) protein